MPKLNKLLSCLIPISTAGALAPVMFGCSKPMWTFKYGDSINCLYKESEIKYHTLAQVQKAVKLKTNKEQPKTISLKFINNDSNRNLQQMYNDIIAGITIISGDPCLIEVKAEEASIEEEFQQLTIKRDSSPTFDQSNLNKTTLKYGIDSESDKCLIMYDNGSGTAEGICFSYIYSECTITPE